MCQNWEITQQSIEPADAPYTELIRFTVGVTTG